MRSTACFSLLAVMIGGWVVPSAARVRPAADQRGASPASLHRALDQILDTTVRDGFVYYRALRAERGRLDRYAASLDVPAATYAGWDRESQMAFWVNAYNAFVLRTVVDHYPIHGAASGYPANSIKQIPGAFDKRVHRAAGRAVTLDQIEKTILPEFKDPRLHLALGRGAVGSGRLSSEAYDGARIAQQLDRIQTEFVTEQLMLRIDRTAGTVTVSSILNWHEKEFAAVYGAEAAGALGQRPPIERAIVAFAMPRLLPLEKEFIQANAFKIVFQPFDWRLNDLTGGRPK